jgi:P-type E1-E2 ATPase
MVLERLLLDANGTLSDRGELIGGIEEQLRELSLRLALHVLSADTFGTARAIAQRIGATFDMAPDAHAKLEHVRKLGARRCAAIGNGSNDALMLQRCAVGISVIGPEGASTAALRSADVICGSIEQALALLLAPDALIATLRC